MVTVAIVDWDNHLQQAETGVNTLWVDKTSVTADATQTKRVYFGTRGEHADSGVTLEAEELDAAGKPVPVNSVMSTSLYPDEDGTGRYLDIRPTTYAESVFKAQSSTEFGFRWLFFRRELHGKAFLRNCFEEKRCEYCIRIRKFGTYQLTFYILSHHLSWMSKEVLEWMKSASIKTKMRDDALKAMQSSLR
jgi:hypothetical protein